MLPSEATCGVRFEGESGGVADGLLVIGWGRFVASDNNVDINIQICAMCGFLAARAALFV